MSGVSFIYVLFLVSVVQPVVCIKACIPPLLQVMIDMNNVKKVLGITRVKRLGGKVMVIH